MKSIARRVTHLIILLTFASLIGSAADSDYLIDSPIQVDVFGKRYDFTAPESIDGPRWDGTGAPPFSIQDAIAVAHSNLKRIYEVEIGDYGLFNLKLYQISGVNGQWCYVIYFGSNPHRSVRGGAIPLCVVVLMDGTIIQPKVQRISTP